MPNLPENNKYINEKDINPIKLPKTKYTFGESLSNVLNKYGIQPPQLNQTEGGNLNIREFLQSKGIDLTNPPSKNSPIGSVPDFTSKPLIPRKTPIGELAGERPPATQPVPEEYIQQQQNIIDQYTGQPRPGLREVTAPQGFQWAKANPESLVLRSPGGIKGQYIVDTSQPGKIVKSGRSITRAEREMLLDGRPSHLFEVDHIIPLWAGGADTLMNYQVLSREEHKRKTKGQAVAYTLMLNNIISPSDAKFYAMTWKNRDLTDIPEPDEYGTIPVDQAIKIKEKWDYQQSQPPKITFKDFLSSIKPAGEDVGKSLHKKTKNLPSFLRNLVEGAARGLTFGWVRNKEDSGSVGGVVGDIGGSTAAIMILSRIPPLTIPSLIGLGALRLSKMFNIVKKTAVLGKGAKTAAGTIKKGADVARKIPRIKVFRPSPVRDINADAIRKVMVDNFARYTPPVVAYGQIRESWEDVPDRSRRFIEDVVYGGLTGFMKPTLAGSLRAGTLAGITSLLLNTDSENPLEDAATSAGIVAALHGLSIPGVKNQAKEEMNKKTEEELKRAALNLFHSYGEEVPFVLPNKKVPDVKLTRDKVVQMRNNARRKLLQMAYGTAERGEKIVGKDFKIKDHAPFMDLDTLLNERRKIETLGEFLEMSTMSGKERQTRELQNMYSIVQKARSGKSLRAEPPILKQVVEKLPEDLYSKSHKSFDLPNMTPEMVAEEFAKKRFPAGYMRTTGLAESYNPNPEKAAYFLKSKSEGRASPTLIAVRRTDLEPHLRYISDSPEFRWTDTDPRNTLQVFGIVTEKDGSRVLVDLGFIPQQKRIEGGTFSFNSQKEIKEGKFRGYPKEMNKDNISKIMDREGIDYLLLNFDDKNSGFLGGKGGDWTKGDKTKPFISFTLNEHNWKTSIALQKGEKAVAPVVHETEKGVESAVNEIDTIKQKLDSATQKTVKDVLASKKPADALFKTPSAVVPLYKIDRFGAESLRNILSVGRRAFSKNSAAEMQKVLEKEFGFSITPEIANNIYELRHNMNVRGFIDLILKYGDEGSVKVVNEFVKPLIQHPEFKTGWELGKDFPSLSIVAKKTAKRSVKRAVKQNALQVEPYPYDKTPTQQTTGALKVEPFVKPKQAPETQKTTQPITSQEKAVTGDSSPQLEGVKGATSVPQGTNKTVPRETVPATQQTTQQEMQNTLAKRISETAAKEGFVGKTKTEPQKPTVQKTVQKPVVKQPKPSSDKAAIEEKPIKKIPEQPKKGKTIKQSDKAMSLPDETNMSAHEMFQLLEGLNKGGIKGGVELKKFNDVLERMKDVLSQKTPKMLQIKMQKAFNVPLNETEAKILFDNRKNITVDQLLGLIRRKTDSKTVYKTVEETIPTAINSSTFWPLEEAYGANIVDFPVLKGGKTFSRVKLELDNTNNLDVKTTQTRKLTPKELQLLKQKEKEIDANIKKHQQGIIDNEINRLSQQTFERLLNVKIEKPNKDRDSFIKKMKGIILSITPDDRIKIPEKNGRVRNIQHYELSTIKNKAQKNLIHRAVDIIEQKFDPLNEIEFKTGNVSDINKPLLDVMKKVIHADNYRKLGDKETAKSIVSELPKKELEEAYRLLSISPIEGAGGKSSIGSSVVDLNEAKNELKSIWKKEGEKEAQKILDGIKTKTKSPDDIYKLSRSIAIFEALKKAGIDIRKKENQWLLGVPFSEHAVSSKYGLIKTNKLHGLTSIPSNEMGDIYHTREYLTAFGEDNPNAIKMAKRKRMLDLMKRRKDIDAGATQTKLNLGGMIDEQDLAVGNMRILSPTQDIGVEKDVNNAWIKLYPALNKSMINNQKLTISDGVRDAKAYVLYVLGMLNKSGFKFSLGFGKEVAKKQGYVNDRNLYYRFIDARTRAYFKNLEEQIRNILKERAAKSKYERALKDRKSKK